MLKQIKVIFLFFFLNLILILCKLVSSVWEDATLLSLVVLAFKAKYICALCELLKAILMTVKF